MFCSVGQRCDSRHRDVGGSTLLSELDLAGILRVGPRHALLSEASREGVSAENHALLLSAYFDLGSLQHVLITLSRAVCLLGPR